ncbi:MAG: SDR family oxidoreductase [Dehalococcoidia bacterium]|nr:SDR family oxidoreductase [Dehalococcoidia bacterium]
MSVLVVGASGATGRLLVRELLGRGLDVRVIVRTPDRLPEDVRNHSRLSMIQANVLDLSQAEMARHVNGCTAVASCLGHNITLKGVFGRPHRLVTDAARRLCEAIQAGDAERPVRFVLMNTVGNRNRDLDEPVSFGQKCVIGILRLLLPPQADNEKAADYLRTSIGRGNGAIEWVAVRPDSLTNADSVTSYDVYPSPIRSALFNPGSTSRINVAHFMAELMTNDETWNRWKGQMPAIYNKASLE